MNQFLGQMTVFAGTYAPQGWMKCEGQSLQVADHPDLYNIIGNTFGGSGGSFNLPDCRGKVLLGAITGTMPIGQIGGQNTVTLTVGQLPKHSHEVNAVSTVGTSNDPTGRLCSNTEDFDHDYSGDNADVKMSNQMISETGQGQPIENRQPFLSVGMIICVCGTYPLKKKCC